MAGSFRSSPWLGPGPRRLLDCSTTLKGAPLIGHHKAGAMLGNGAVLRVLGPLPPHSRGEPHVQAISRQGHRAPHDAPVRYERQLGVLQPSAGLAGPVYGLADGVENAYARIDGRSRAN